MDTVGVGAVFVTGARMALAVAARDAEGGVDLHGARANELGLSVPDKLQLEGTLATIAENAQA